MYALCIAFYMNQIMDYFNNSDIKMIKFPFFLKVELSMFSFKIRFLSLFGAMDEENSDVK